MAVPANALAGQYEEIEVAKDITIDKKVKKPGTDNYYDNLFASDYKFSPEQEVVFLVKVKNTGDKGLEDVKYQDILPEYLKHVAGDMDETFDLDIGQTKEFEIKAQVVSKDSLPNSQGTYCVVNKAEAWMNGDKDSDTSQVCISKEGEVLGIYELPKAGPENSLMLILGTLCFGMAGWALAKKK